VAGRLELRDIAEKNTKEIYRDDLRLRVRPFFEHYTLGRSPRVGWSGFSRPSVQRRTLAPSTPGPVLNQLFTCALRHEAMPRNPVEGTSSLARPTNQILALTLEQVQAIRGTAEARWTGPGTRGPNPTARSATPSKFSSALHAAR